jgi:hypothetical protein
MKKLTTQILQGDCSEVLKTLEDVKKFYFNIFSFILEP